MEKDSSNFKKERLEKYCILANKKFGIENTYTENSTKRDLFLKIANYYDKNSAMEKHIERIILEEEIKHFSGKAGFDIEMSFYEVCLKILDGSIDTQKKIIIVVS